MNITRAIGCVVARREDTWPILYARYNGVCRGRWWPLSEQSADPQSRALTAVRENDLLMWDPGVPKVDCSSDLSYLRTYVEACERLAVAPLYALVCSSRDDDAPIEWLEDLRGDCAHLGVDLAYGSGSFSFINGDLGTKDDELAKYLAVHLNAHGLFETFEAAEAFMVVHQRALDRGVNLETLDGVMPIELWEDPDLSRLRKRLRGLSG